MQYATLISGFIIGAAGSLHCIGMCGPISFALPIKHLQLYQKISLLLLYQIGRIITYSSIGLLFGLLGRNIYLAGLQQWYSIIAGSLLILLAILYFTGKRMQNKSVLPIRLYNKVQQQIVKIIASQKKWYSYVALGMANGLLPCGMVYVALASTLSLSTAIESAGFMAAFGSGTLPAMMLIGIAGQQIKPATRFAFNKLIPGFMLLLGVVLILRGLNLGIPFLSPQLPAAPGETVVCHN